MASTQNDSLPGGSLAAATANLVVQTVREFTGRGPTKARAYFNDDLITVVLQDTLTKGERSLARDGKADLVLSTRHAFQQTMRTELVAAIEQLTGRQVIAFLSDNHIDPDVAIESFVLAPERKDSSSADTGDTGDDVTAASDGNDNRRA